MHQRVLKRSSKHAKHCGNSQKKLTEEERFRLQSDEVKKHNGRRGEEFHWCKLDRKEEVAGFEAAIHRFWEQM